MLNFGAYGDRFPGPFGLMGGGQMSPAFMQAMQASQGTLAQPPAPPQPPAPGPQGTFEQQLMSKGGWTTPPAQMQNPWLQGQPGINPRLAGILSMLPPRPTGLPQGMPGPTGAIVDTPRYGPNAPQQPLPPAILTNLIRQQQFDRSGRRGDTGGRQGWGGPADHADRASTDHGFGHSGAASGGTGAGGHDPSAEGGRF